MRGVLGRVNTPRWLRMAAEKRAETRAHREAAVVCAEQSSIRHERARPQRVTQETAWKLATVTGTLGLLLLLLMQLAAAMSLPRPSDEEQQATIAQTSTVNDDAGSNLPMAGTAQDAASDDAVPARDPFAWDTPSGESAADDLTDPAADDELIPFRTSEVPLATGRDPAAGGHALSDDIPDNPPDSGADLKSSPVAGQGNHAQDHEPRPLVELDIVPVETLALADDSETLSQHNEHFLVTSPLSASGRGSMPDREPAGSIDLDETDLDSPAATGNQAGWHPFRTSRFERLSEPLFHQRSSSGVDPAVIVAAFEDRTPTVSAAEPAKDVQIAITRRAPREVIAGDDFQYGLIVRNVSAARIDAVHVEECLPSNCRLLNVAPAAEFEEQTLRWNLGSLDPDEERQLNVWLSLHQPEPSEHRAQVRTEVAVASDTLVSAPQLALGVTRNPSIRSGGVCRFRYEVVNAGVIAADDVRLLVNLPAELTHAKGRALRLELGSLEPGARRVAYLSARAQGAGSTVSECQVVSRESVLQTASTPVEIGQTPSPAPRSSAALSRRTPAAYGRCVPRRLW